MSMYRSLLFLAALACTALRCEHGFADDGTIADKPSVAPRREASPIPAATGTGVNRADRSHRVLRDLRYGDESSGVRNMLDLYLPDEAAGKTPVVIAVHGGGLRRGSKEMFRPKAVKLAERGYAVAAVNYRLSPEHYLPAQIHDVKAAVRWVRAHAADYGLDPRAERGQSMFMLVLVLLCVGDRNRPAEAGAHRVSRSDLPLYGPGRPAGGYRAQRRRPRGLCGTAGRVGGADRLGGVCLGVDEQSPPFLPGAP